MFNKQRSITPRDSILQKFFPRIASCGVETTKFATFCRIQRSALKVSSPFTVNLHSCDILSRTYLGKFVRHDTFECCSRIRGRRKAIGSLRVGTPLAMFPSTGYLRLVLNAHAIKTAVSSSHDERQIRRWDRTRVRYSHTIISWRTSLHILQGEVNIHREMQTCTLY